MDERKRDKVLRALAIGEPIDWDSADPSHLRRWRLVWIAWAAFFAVAETKAMKSGHACAPLSWHMRHVLGVRRRSKLGRAVFAGAAAWLTAHLFKVG